MYSEWSVLLDREELLLWIVKKEVGGKHSESNTFQRMTTNIAEKNMNWTAQKKFGKPTPKDVEQVLGILLGWGW